VLCEKNTKMSLVAQILSIPGEWCVVHPSLNHKGSDLTSFYFPKFS
jgi:hypothetical protein